MSLDPTQLSNLLGVASTTLQEQVNTKIADTLQTLEGRLYHKLTPPVVLFDLKGTTAGQAIINNVTGEQAIRLNLPALNNPEFRDYIINQTVPHEVAHLVEYQLYGTIGHGYRWQQLMRLLNLPPDRTHDLPLPKARNTKRHNHACACQNHVVSTTLHNRIERGKVYLCQACGCRLQREANT